MEERLKKRLIGAAVLTSLVVIFVPMLFEKDGGGHWNEELRIPPRPTVPEGFATRILPAPTEDLARAPATTLKTETSPKIPSMPTAPQSPSTSGPLPAAAAASGQAVNQKTDKGRGPRAWVLQVASFSSRKNADQLVTRLRAKKFPAFQEEASVDGTKVFRVRIGPELDRKLAEKMLKRVTKEFKLKGQIVRYP